MIGSLLLPLKTRDCSVLPSTVMYRNTSHLSRSTNIGLPLGPITSRTLCNPTRYSSMSSSPILHLHIPFPILRNTRIAPGIRHVLLFFVLGHVSSHQRRLATRVGIRPTLVHLLRLLLFPLSLTFPLLLCVDLLCEEKHVTRANLPEMLQVLISCGSQSQPRPPLFILRKRVS